MGNETTDGCQVPRETQAVGIGIALAILVAGSSVAYAGPASANAADAASVVGTWDMTVQLITGASEQDFVTLHSDGTVSAVAPPGPLPCPSGSGTCTLGNASLGRWVMTGPSTFRITITEYVMDSSGNLVNFFIPDLRATLSANGNSYSCVTTLGIWTAQGTWLTKVPSSDREKSVPSGDPREGSQAV